MEKIIDVILNYVEPDEEITGSSLLKQDCGLTSFDTTCVIGELCDSYGVDPSALDLRKVKTVKDLQQALETAAAAVAE
ncbi:MAG: acyl carrier protein [Clostridia bacterium]|nr:acyl carrier protein [Clostridia bacterium]